MPRPKEGYKLADGTTVPGVTTVIGNNLAWNKGALIGWAYKQGKEGRPLRESQEEAKNIGTIAHALIEAELKKIPMTINVPPEQKDAVDNCLLAFYEWQSAFDPVITHSELSLVSEAHRFGCTIDYGAQVVGRRVLLEVKTGTGDAAYSDWRIQMAAQAKAWNERIPTDPITGYHLLKVGKDDASFAHFYWPQLDREWEVFQLLLGLEGLRKEVAK